MCMTPTRSTKVKRMKTLLHLTALSLLLVGAAQAQTTKAPQIRLDWPRTFTGQPDFEFERSEVLKERTLENNRQGRAKPTPPTLADLIEGDSPEPIEIDTLSLVTSETGVAEGDGLEGVESYGLSASSLPSLTLAGTVNLAEFKNNLQQAIRYTVQGFKPDLRIYALDFVLRGLKLEGVVSSPVKYCIISGQRYEVGDRFQVKAAIGPTDKDLLDVMEERMPDKASLPDEMYKAYQEAYEEIVQRLADDREKNPAKYQRTFTLPVIVRDIQERKVIIEFQGQRHELKVNMAL